jgi:multicomponent Na+:H+ antiporter subunit D
MGLGLALANNELAAGFGVAAGLLYLVHHMIIKTALLMAGGVAELDMGTGRLADGYLGGLAQRRPLLAVLFFLAAFSLAGIPPFSGFVSKLGLLQIALDARQWWIAAISQVVSLLTLLNMIRVWQYGFTGSMPPAIVAFSPLAHPQQRRMALAPIAILIAASLVVGIFSETFFRWSNVAATQLLDRAGYIQAVAPTDEIMMLEEVH